VFDTLGRHRDSTGTFVQANSDERRRLQSVIISATAYYTVI